MAQLRRNPLIAAVLALAIVMATAAQGTKHAAVEVSLGDGFGVFRVVNHGPLISLDAAVEVEHRVNGVWTDARVTNLNLVSKCSPGSIPKCIPVASGSTIQPVAWRGSYCYSQCPVSCDLDGPLPAGTYRFAIYSCDRKHHFVSPAFEKNPPGEKRD